MDPGSRAFRAYAHRGGALEAPENSLGAFTRAWSLGYVHLETDVRPTRDGVAVVHHDADLDRTTDGRGRVRDRAWRDIRELRHADGGTPLRLEELLEAFPDAYFTIDAKEAGSVVALVDAVRRCRAEPRVCLASFSARRLARARRLLAGSVESAAHPWEVLALRSLGAPLPRAQRVQVPERAMGVAFARRDVVERAHRRGLAVDIWTVNDRDRMEALLDIGVDGIMTDAPSLLREVLAERHMWPSVR